MHKIGGGGGGGGGGVAHQRVDIDHGNLFKSNSLIISFLPSVG